MTAPARSALDVGASVTAEAFGPWNPGIESQLPRELLALSTLFRPENVRTGLADVLELSDLTGLDLFDLVAFRPERLALHELLVRVTADLSVPSGSRVEDLGINFREMVNTLLANHVAARMPDVIATYDRLRAQLASMIATELATRIPRARERSRRAGFQARQLAAAHAAPAHRDSVAARTSARGRSAGRDRRVASRGAGRIR